MNASQEARAEGKGPLVQVAIYLPWNVRVAVTSAADESGISRSAWIVAAIEEKLARERSESGQGAE